MWATTVLPPHLPAHSLRCVLGAIHVRASVEFGSVPAFATLTCLAGVRALPCWVRTHATYGYGLRRRLGGVRVETPITLTTHQWPCHRTSCHTGANGLALPPQRSGPQNGWQAGKMCCSRVGVSNSPRSRSGDAWVQEEAHVKALCERCEAPWQTPPFRRPT